MPTSEMLHFIIACITFYALLEFIMINKRYYLRENILACIHPSIYSKAN
jgi:hypothetical protein